MRELYVYIFLFNCALILFELNGIKRLLKAMVQELDDARRVLIDAKESLEQIAHSVKTPEEKAASAEYLRQYRERQAAKALGIGQQSAED